MPGIFGVIGANYNGREEQQAMAKMLQRKEWLQQQLVTNRLGSMSIISVPSMTQRSPAAQDQANGSTCLLYGYLSNAQQLRNRFGLPADMAHSAVALSVYQAVGEECFELLDGSYNLFISDDRTGWSYLVNDPYGHLPIYYHVAQQEGRLSIAPELKCFKACSWVPKEPCWAAVSEYFVFGQPWNSKTLLQGVFGIEPGCLLKWRPAEYSVKRYWQLKYNQGEVGRTINSRELCHDLHRELVATTAVMNDLPGRRGIFLSGGFDSRIIACYAQRLDKQLEALAMQFNGQPAQDSVISERIAATLNIPWKTIDYVLSANDAPRLLNEHLVLHDGTWPSVYFPNCLPLDDIRSRYDFILNANNGNHVFGDYATKFMMNEMQLMNEGIQYDQFKGMLGDGLHRALTFRMLTDTFRSNGPLLNESFANDAVKAAVQGFDQAFWARTDIVGACKFEYLAMTQTGRRWGLFNIPLMDYFEQINPLFHRKELLELMGSLPLEWKFSRLLNSETLIRYFPEVAALPKISGYGNILRYQENVIDPKRQVDDYYDVREVFAVHLARTIDDLVNDATFLERHWINQATVRKAWDDHKSGRGNNSAPLSALMALDYFFRTFIDR